MATHKSVHNSTTAQCSNDSIVQTHTPIILHPSYLYKLMTAHSIYYADVTAAL